MFMRHLWNVNYFTPFPPRAFFAIRGSPLQLRYKRGINFVAAKTKIDQAQTEMDKQSVPRYLPEQRPSAYLILPTHPPSVVHWNDRWNNRTHTGCHAVGVRVTAADPWATWYPDVRSCSNSQRSPDHSYTCRYQWTPPTATSNVAATNDVPTWHPPRKLYIARSLTKGDGEGFNFLQTSFGLDGDVSISTICKPGQNGPRRHGT